MKGRAFRLAFCEDENGNEPVRRWLREQLSRAQRLVVGTAMREILEEEESNVCGTEFGRQLGRGLFEFRVRGSLDEFVQTSPGSEPAEEKILIRVFCHAFGDKVILLLAGYDKLAHPSKSRQNEEIELARKRLRAWKLRQARGRAPGRSS